MRKHMISLFVSVFLLLELLPWAYAAAPQERRWLLPEGLLVEQMTDSQLSSGGLAPGEDAADFPRGEDGISGTCNVLVAPVRFAGEEDFLGETPGGYSGKTVEQLIDSTYSGTDISVGTYYDQISFGAVDINPIWLLDGGESIRLPHERSYYMPLSLDNENGYLLHYRQVRIYTPGGRAEDWGVYLPELSCQRTSARVEDHILLNEDTGELLAICSHMDVRAQRRGDGRLELIWNGQMSQDHSWSDSACFYTGDYAQRQSEFCAEVYCAVNALAYAKGVRDVDCTTIWFSGGATDWGALLWPHQSEFTANGPTYYREGADKRYIALLTQNTLGTPVQGHLADGTQAALPETGTLAHELGHVLGFPDYYSYCDLNGLYLGSWSLMEMENAIPQNLHGWAAYLYGGWLGEENVREISQEGRYTITTLSGADREERDGGAAYLYYIQNSAGDPDYPEQIVLEYRSPRGAFEQALQQANFMPIPGLILYSVDDDAERHLGGNINATGQDGRYGAKLYYTSGMGENAVAGYEDMSSTQRQLYDMILSPLTAKDCSLAVGGVLAAHGSYGSPRADVTENALVSRRTGKNSGVVICGAVIDPADPAKLSFWADLDEPEVERVQDNGRMGVRTVTLTYDEPVSAGPGLVQVSAAGDSVSAQVEDCTLELTLTGNNGGGVLNVPADAVMDQAGRAMEADWVMDLEPAHCSAEFSDVTESHRAWAAVTATADTGLFRGVTEDRFAPDATMTRGMFVTVLGRMAGIRPMGEDSGFWDVDRDSWYAPYVAWAAENGVVDGEGNGAFAPEQAITREQMAGILCRYLSWREWTLPTQQADLYQDDDRVSDWAREGVYAVQTAGIMTGKGNGCFDPAGTATRAEAAQVIWKCMELE